jgi:glycosyltransferase involved in cell wall biosynthesis
MVDDGSPDNCPALCDEYAKQDSRVKVIHKQNGGLGYARNSGLELALGEFVAFVDSDDFVDLNMYQTLYQTAKEHKLDTVYCGLCFYKDERHISPRKEVDAFTVFTGREEVNGFLLDMVGPEPSYKRSIKYLISAWRSIYSMDIINANNIKFYSEREFISEDLLFNIDYLTKARAIAYQPLCFYYYCHNETSLTYTYRLEKYSLYKNYLLEVKRKLDSCYGEKAYIIHYKRLLFFNLFAILKQNYLFAESNKTSVYSALKDSIQDSFWKEIFINYPYWRLPLKQLAFYLLLKYKLVRIIQLLFKTNIV